MKWYGIMELWGKLYSDDNVVQAKNSKEALEKYLGKKVKRTEDNPQYCVYASNEKGQHYQDRRRDMYYKII